VKRKFCKALQKSSVADPANNGPEPDPTFERKPEPDPTPEKNADPDTALNKIL
jgi:hypothetical protein